MNEQIYSKLTKIMAEVYGVERANITPDLRLKEDMGEDDLGRMELVVDLEEEFGIEITDEDAEGWFTVQQVADWVEENSEG